MKIHVLKNKRINFRALILAALFGLISAGFVFSQDQGEAGKCLEGGKANLDQRNFDLAIANLTKAIELDPTLAEAFFWRGISNYYKIATASQTKQFQAVDGGAAKGYEVKYAQTIADLNRAIELEPQNAEWYGTRGGFYMFVNDPTKALEDLNKALEIDPKNEEGFKSLGFFYHVRGNYDKAIEYLGKAIEINSKNAEAYRDRAMAYEGKGDFKNAITDWNRLIQLDSPAGMTYLQICDDHRKLGQLDEAIASCTKAIESNPGRLEEESGYKKRAELYLEQKRNDLAIGDYTKAIEWNVKNMSPFPVPYKLYQDRANIYANTGKFGLAIADYTKALSQPAGTIEKAGLYKLRSLVYRQQGKTALAMADVSREIEMLKKAAKE